MFLAGPLAEARFRGATAPDAIDELTLAGAACDHRAVVELAEYASGSVAEADAFIQWLTHHTWNWIRDDLWWCSVERLAEALLAVETMRYRPARLLVTTTRLQRIQRSMDDRSALQPGGLDGATAPG